MRKLDWGKNNMIDLQDMGQRARAAALELARATTAQKNAALLAMADALDANAEAILAANQLDLDDGQKNGLSAALLDRLDLQKRLGGIVADVRHVGELPDPVGLVFDAKVLDNGLKVSKRRVPVGVLGVIYEARPNVTVDVAALALKSGNAVILRGGSETFRSNMALVKVLREALVTNGFPADAFQYIESTDRQYVAQMLKLHQYIDMIIPRGGNALHTLCRENSTIPVITGGIGICHLYVDEFADQDAALKIIHNAKTQRPSVCNALDTVLVNRQLAAAFLPRVVEHLGKDGVIFKAEPRALEALKGRANGYTVDPAGPEDFDTEWLALILGLKVVDGLDDALDHIRQHSTQHSDGILTQNLDHANRFLDEVDSAAVYVNASTRFTDGSALGLGAEIAISTQRLHARGPMALEELTTYKWVIIGDGHVRP
ncbi:MAG TPA: glutamate-5-semialdehyde dehydrogenase [Phototrophicaceae bacterium]|nr:glutamate-5-semialdehyde dehydrogenase [Phototrophicaceae bacterium]